MQYIKFYCTFLWNRNYKETRCEIKCIRCIENSVLELSYVSDPSLSAYIPGTKRFATPVTVLMVNKEMVLDILLKWYGLKARNLALEKQVPRKSKDCLI